MSAICMGGLRSNLQYDSEATVQSMTHDRVEVHSQVASEEGGRILVDCPRLGLPLWSPFFLTGIFRRVCPVLKYFLLHMIEIMQGTNAWPIGFAYARVIAWVDTGIVRLRSRGRRPLDGRASIL
jgi:hypothetical protein